MVTNVTGVIKTLCDLCSKDFILSLQMFQYCILCGIKKYKIDVIETDARGLKAMSVIYSDSSIVRSPMGP